MAKPTLIDVSVRPSVSDQPAGHLVRSIVKPSGPVTVFPSADLPHLLSVMRFTIAARSLVHSASHASIGVGCAAAAVVDVDPPDDAVVVVDAPAMAVVVAEALSLSSPPHAAATSARLTNS